MRRKLPTGVRVLPNGRLQAYIRLYHGQGGLKSRCFPADTALSVLKAWREEQRVRYRLGERLPEGGETLGEAIRKYLPQIQSMPTRKEREQHLTHWLDVFGAHRPRKRISASDIRSELERLRSAGYAGSTLNHFKSALSHLWTTLDGRSAPNPARDLPRYRDESLDAPPRALSPSAVKALLGAMPRSQTRARLTLMAWTGWPQRQISRLEPSDIDWDRAVFVRPRRKGKGAAGVWLPLLPQGWQALREFKRLGCWGSFSTSSMRKSLRTAAERVRAKPKTSPRVKAELEDVTPYMLRHSFATMVAAATQDDRAVMSLLQHSDIRTTHRYTEASVDPRVAAALSLVARRLKSAS